MANLSLPERAELGRAFESTVAGRSASGNVFAHRAMHVDSKPEWVYVVCSSAGLAPEDLEKLKWNLMVGALAHFRKTHCLLIIDREGKSYEVAMVVRPSPASSPAEREVGHKLFGHLRMTDRELSLIPAS